MTPTIKLTAAALMLGAVLAGCQQPADRAATGAEKGASTAQASTDAHAFKIGALDAWSLKDGEMTHAVSGDTLPWADKAAVTAVLTAAGQPTDSVTLSINPLLVKDGDRVVLIDTGAGGGMGTQGKLLASLRAAGVTPDQVTDVLISHSHGDHTGGLVTNGALTFPNATVRMTTAEWNFMKSNADAAAVVTAITPKVQAFEPGAKVTPSITAVPFQGHTPGHTGYEIANGGQTLLYIGDVLHSHIVSVSRPDLEINYDQANKAAAIATRRALLARAAEQGTLVYAVHFPYPALGHIQRQGDGYVWAPVR